ncbi:flagellar biosynthesis anti-sigma factor FlgM [Sphingomonas changnyeongensis]|uniref:Negative regulator of flagellin synthesis n=1 Tax=Sphingomonas changnyeongensis TaxID=2698679 RepID=A0A7Z2NVC7_9SPHN|nr:flagellar biosynthesis anti-sigma factor FlgM [Sphingomonas changnyeongensis]QHL90161.1 flagellar biosynthesis anti-sigma factor FlgM [Sphingomonas changnyeongensis]
MRAERASAGRADAPVDTRRAAREMAARPPVDADRVAEIRRALEEGRFPITPARIADRLIAAKMLWAKPDEQD